ncbi:MAG: hypothetical protein A3A28_04340 [Candidatus Sungbacteria bacterium RIFCSPLOWO2_01_FULL_47_32]|uniref:NAD-dependent epimerase/dehydratase domain-containing protein n=1 Tax=Candidatus Sungbacteria bacterium RIFCSPHIGHO2_01_FULL_47_32 TaxID=1802264 RepID=A0A1G2K925_9BACT|nr:MAG: hypothetical protein UX72_C0002G0023 [Parcubacteria group bacterium GW2011_GWA2_47_10]OGZ94980.1 MAG: hypothetical protein A2633_05960 [Candidatus Sungbacteria bacterium RIFCSPHIGHO2_01_FULL_47_32]OGZ99405.1 MAG: hypothetical protein A3D57_00920 [Candidatus Sungbacteria bacterium RIFCSPHIGHO2_02_FULL_46_12]OHA05644.1 MAG: hypothetical protein A3A28_04340 [Candidatus Sungbacteria bacterium RIFCSPLOWO2_01_FULL_47_32]
MKILFIGGSRFVGPLVIEELLERGHEVTVFNRGLLRQSYPKEVTFVKGNRNRGFPFKERFDSVIDTCAYREKQTERVIRELKFDFLVHISTAAVYKKTETFPLIEESPLGDWPVWGDYNKGKVECEKTLAVSGLPYATIRPVYILGPKNYLARESFIYSKIKNGLPTILPGNGRALIQFIFADEVAETIVLIAENKNEGAFNIAGNDTITLKGLVEEMSKIVGKEPIIKYNLSADSEKFNEVEFPFANENFAVSNEKIKRLGIKFVPLLEGLRRDYKNYYRHVI